MVIYRGNPNFGHEMIEVAASSYDASIALLCYNQENYIKEALNAILNQQGVFLEIIVSDDGSTDKTYEIISSVLANYKGQHHVRCIRHSKNLGFVKNFCETIKRCSSEYIIYAAGDDISYPDRALKIVDAFQKSGALLVHSHAVCVNEKDETMDRNYPLKLTGDKLNLNTISVSSALYLGATGAYSRELFEKYGYFEEKNLLEDLVLGFRAALEDRINFVNEELIIYRTTTGLTSKYNLSKSNYYEFRANYHKRMVAVLTQRLDDLKKSTLRRKQKVLRVLKNEILIEKIRMSLWKDNLNFLRGFKKFPTIKYCIEFFKYRRDIKHRR